MAKGKYSPVISPQMRLSFEEEREVRREDDISVRCVQCGKRFAQPRWYVEKGIRSQYCSAECRSNWELASPDEPFELVLEGRPEYRGGNWKTQARLARERNGFCCSMCGITEEELGRQHDVHHKVPFRLFDSPIEANRLSNLVSVCPSCHKKLEDAGRADMPLFEDVKHPRQRSK
jgi:DNA-directed RNA polymerase subunit RPC12/RpoP